ncbi:helix-turn-helix domain-containing protein [Thermoflavimicrobium daqui]|uniref:Transcriptional regulator n=1 Tax=Thermoflavimicrobium daqui TaxID=2137476 RepID=A0A364K665_9BACL|nr:helix-turn-helix transcriptional regulator [Thermoflavimicrobium daqui]RAL25702.1 transcriptional regulator [Thermoflavimicrobium daqui]
MKKKQFILQKYLDQLNWNQSVLSRESGVPTTVISRYLKGSRTYTIEYLIAIKEALQQNGITLHSIEDLFEKDRD